MNLAKIGSVLVALTIAGLLYWHRSAARDKVVSHAEAVEAAVVKALATCDTNTRAHDFIEKNEPGAHQLAWDESYTPAQRRKDPRFDEKKYCQVYFEHLIQLATIANLRDLDQPLRQAQIEAEKNIASLPHD